MKNGRDGDSSVSYLTRLWKQAGTFGWRNVGVLEARRLRLNEIGAHYDLESAMKDEGEDLRLK